MAKAVVWLVLAVFTVMSAIALVPSASLKVTMGPILLWSFCALYVLGGFLHIFVPSFIRNASDAFSSRTPVRLVGLCYMIIGAALFRIASTTSLPLLPQIIGVIVFVEGGVQLLLPTVAITIIEWWRDKSFKWFALAGLGAFVLAVLFAYAALHTARPGGAPADPATAVTAPAAPQGPAALPEVLPPSEELAPAPEAQ